MDGWMNGRCDKFSAIKWKHKMAAADGCQWLLVHQEPYKKICIRMNAQSQREELLCISHYQRRCGICYWY